MALRRTQIALCAALAVGALGWILLWRPAGDTENVGLTQPRTPFGEPAAGPELTGLLSDGDRSVADTRRVTAVPDSRWTLQAVGDVLKGAELRWAASTGDGPVRELGGSAALELAIPEQELSFPCRVIAKALVDGRGPVAGGAADFAAPPADRVLRVHLRAGSTLRGRVVDHEGLPVQAGVIVVALAAGVPHTRVDAPDSTGMVWQATSTAEGGTYALFGLAAGEAYRVSAAGGGWASRTEIAVTLDQTDVALDIPTKPLYGLVWRTVPRVAAVRWDRGIVVIHRPALRTDDAAVFNVSAVRLLPAYAEYTQGWNALGAALRTAESAVESPHVTVVVDAPEYEVHRSVLPLQRVDRHLPQVDIEVTPYAANAFDLTVMWQYPPALVDLDRSTVLGSLRVAADDREWSSTVRRSDLDGLFLEGLPASLSRVRFVANSGARFPRGVAFAALLRQDDNDYATVIDLTDGGVVQFELRGPAEAAYTGPATITLVEGEFPGPPVAGAPPEFPPRPAQTHSFVTAPYRVAMIAPGKYHAAVTHGVHMLGVIQAFDVVDRSPVTVQGTVRPPQGAQ